MLWGWCEGRDVGLPAAVEAAPAHPGADGLGATLMAGPLSGHLTVTLSCFFLSPFQEDEADGSEEVKEAWVSDSQWACPSGACAHAP